MVILLESDLAEEREKTVQLQTENESLSGKVSEMIKL